MKKTEKKKADENGCLFRLTSAKTERENINSYLNELVSEYIAKKLKNNEPLPQREESFALQYNIQNNKKKKKCCEK